MRSLPTLLLAACVGGKPSDTSGDATGDSAPPPTTIPRDACGGFGGTPCATGYTCLDDPSDTCDPLAGGADCGGLCYGCDEPVLQRDYVSHDPAECQGIDFDCATESVPFVDECGCGCSPR